MRGGGFDLNKLQRLLVALAISTAIVTAAIMALVAARDPNKAMQAAAVLLTSLTILAALASAMLLMLFITARILGGFHRAPRTP